MSDCSAANSSILDNLRKSVKEQVGGNALGLLQYKKNSSLNFCFVLYNICITKRQELYW